MKIPLSDRLRACCNFISPGDRVADIGCDHGYLSIYLITQCIASSVIASDINEGPLHSAMINAEKFGIRERIAFYLSNGVQNIPRDFDTLVCAGMGGDTMISILEAAPWLQNGQYRLILQCQSKRPMLRRYLSDHGWHIARETLVKEGKFFYPIMEVIYAPGHSLTDAQCHISPALLADRSPLLPEFIRWVTGGLQTAVKGLARTGGEKYVQQKKLLEELQSLHIPE
ncbi:MAG: SAM-dependent methyltransferase [Ruminococcaceae bacterium]|nr:SAM-dependent methyltransferase [Oscillospiraceae bacterium]